MSLESKYGASDVIKILNNSSLVSSASCIENGGVSVPSYYENEHCIVLSPATDTLNTNAQMLQTISQGLKQLPNLANSQKKILIPVAQEQKILGLFKRNHWVTVQYDPKENKATVLDSRPWLVSFLYPMTALKNELKQGIASVYNIKTAQTIEFSKKYQGVQFNDKHCGAWTTQNILDLASQTKQTSIDQQTKKYSSKDENRIIQKNILLAKGLATLKHRQLNLVEQQTSAENSNETPVYNISAPTQPNSPSTYTTRMRFITQCVCGKINQITPLNQETKTTADDYDSDYSNDDCMTITSQSKNNR